MHRARENLKKRNSSEIFSKKFMESSDVDQLHDPLPKRGRGRPRGAKTLKRQKYRDRIYRDLAEKRLLRSANLPEISEQQKTEAVFYEAHLTRPKFSYNTEWHNVLVDESLNSIQTLIYLRDNAFGEKVRLDAARDLLDRMGASYGKQFAAPKTNLSSIPTEKLQEMLNVLDSKNPILDYEAAKQKGVAVGSGEGEGSGTEGNL